MCVQFRPLKDANNLTIIQIWIKFKDKEKNIGS